MRWYDLYFCKSSRWKIGNSIVEDDKLDLALDIIAKAKAKGVNLVLGSDCVAADAFSNDAHTQVVPANNIPDGWEGLDAGPETQKAFAAAIEDAKTILWNGPAGVLNSITLLPVHVLSLKLSQKQLRTVHSH